MNTEMAYLIGMILGNGEIQQGPQRTTITITIPYKNLRTDDSKDVAVYVKASIVDIRSIIEPLIGYELKVSQEIHSTTLSFSKPNEEYVIREILRLIDCGKHHSTMKMNQELFTLTRDQKKSLLRGIADVTAYARNSNKGRGEHDHRVYIEVPRNWYMVIDICNMLKSIDIPVETIDFAHPNTRDGKLTKYNTGHVNFWKKEHQIKVFANEFLPVGFNIKHKQDALEKFALDVVQNISVKRTHRFYWETRISTQKEKPIHPGENDPSLPPEIRGTHFNSWKEIAEAMGYGK